MNHASTKLIPTEEERQALLRAFRSWTDNPTMAEDLVQQTMLEAWKSDRQPEPDEWRPWLFGVARNVLLRWRRELARDLRRSIETPASTAIFEATSADIDIESELEQREIVNLLHNLLELLPEETRRILLLKYVDEMPQQAIAEELDLHEKAVEGRLHRGKKALRQQLLTFRPDEAVHLGIIVEPNTWQQTMLWCRICGRHELLARWSDNGKLWFDCPACEHGERSRIFEGGLFGPNANNRRPTFGRAVNYFQTQTERCIEVGREQAVPCPNPVCQGTLSHRSDEVVNPSGSQLIVPAVFRCDSCDATLFFEDLCDCGIDVATGRDFMSRYPRVKTLPRTKIIHHGIQSLQTRWVAVGDTAEFVTWHDADTGQIIDTYISDA